MTENKRGEIRTLSPEREAVFARAERDLQYSAEVYRLGDRFEGLPSEYAGITILDVTKIPGCHYGLKNPFVPIIKDRELNGFRVGKKHIDVSPETAILVETSTGNACFAGKDAADEIGYEFIAVMPDNLPEVRYKHPLGKDMQIIKTPDYAIGMAKKLKTMMFENINRLANGEKIYIFPNHSAGKSAEITVQTLSELGRQLIANIGISNEPIRVVASMGNGASVCALGEYVKNHTPNAKVVATESFSYGGGYDRFAKGRNQESYEQLFGISPGNTALMAEFSAYGTNAPIGIKMPLHERAFNGNLLDNYGLFTDDRTLNAFESLNPDSNYLRNALNIPNVDYLPRALYETYGNSTIGNIAIAAGFTGRDERVVAMAYDGRENY